MKPQSGKGQGAKRRAAPPRKRGSSSRFYAALVVIAIIGIGAIAWLATRSKGGEATTLAANVDPGNAKPYILGDTNAPVKVMEFADFECPACGLFNTLTEPDVRSRLIDSGKVVLRYYDFPVHPDQNTWEASNAAACADEQGKFWPMHDMLFHGQDQWNAEVTRHPKDEFEQYAKQIGLDVDQWSSCFDQRKYQSRIQANRAQGDKLMVQSTPTFVIGNKLVAGALGYDEFRKYVDSALVKARSTTASGPTTTAAQGAASGR